MAVAVPSTSTAAAPAKPGGLTDRARAERKLAWILCAPAVAVMLLVAGFPIVYAFWLSLRRADLRFPDAGEFVGLSNFVTVLSVVLELALGMLIAQAMYRAIFARTAIRASVLVPYGAVTVVAAFAWRLAFDPTTGFAVAWLNLDPPPLTTHWGSMAIIIMAEVWKTTPFIA